MGHQRWSYICLCVWLVATRVQGQTTELQTIESRVRADLLSSLPSTSTVTGYQSSLQVDGSWADVNYADTSATAWLPQTHLTRLRDMTKLYNASSSSLYQNATLLADISRAYDYWITRNPTSTNWWQNEIGAPQAMGDIMILMKPQLTSAQTNSGITILTRAYKPRTINSGTNTGTNRVYRANVGVKRSIVANDSALTSEMYQAIGDTLVITTAEGMQRDNSFLQHGPQLYNYGYGSEHLNLSMNWAAMAAGTSLGITTTQQQTVIDHMLDGSQWMVRGETYDLTAMGRGVSRKGYSTSANVLLGQLSDVMTLGTYRASELQAFQTRQQTSNSNDAANLSQGLTGHKHFWRGDLSVHHRPAYYASVKISSTRTYQPETGNNEGLKNLHLADGVNLIMRTGNEYYDIAPVWDWRRLPGTTIEQGTYSLKPGTSWGIYGTATFAGGVSDGMNGATTLNYNRLNVAAKKSWFFFDDAFLALGSAINAANATNQVNTTLNQTLLKGNVSYRTTSGTTQTLTTGTITPTNLNWVHHDGVGYLFFNPVSNATLMANTQTGTWQAINAQYDTTVVSKNVFTLYLNHGTAVNNANYSYLVLPGVTVAQMESYATGNWQILQNDATIQAVRNSNSDLTQATFYNAGLLTISPSLSLNANNKSLVMMQRQGQTIKLSAASPESLSFALGLTINGLPLRGPNASWSGSTPSSSLTMSLPSGDLAGSSVSQTYGIANIFHPTSNTATNWSAGTNWSQGTPTSGEFAQLVLFDTTGNTALPTNFQQTTNYDVSGGLQINALDLGGQGAATGTTNQVVIQAVPGTPAISLAGTSLTPEINLAANNGTAGLNYQLNTPLVLANNTTVKGNGTAQFTFNGTISGTGRLTKTGTSTLDLTVGNTFTGGVTIASGGGNLVIHDPAALGTGTVTLSKAGTNSGTLVLDLTGTNVITNTFAGFNSATALSGGGTATIQNRNGRNTITSNLTVTSTGGNGLVVQSDAGPGNLLELSGDLTTTLTNRMLNLGGTGNGLISGDILDGTGAIPFNLQKDGSGTWTLLGQNTWTGTTTINAGAVVLGDGTTPNAGTLGATAIAINVGGNLIWNRIENLAVTNTITGTGTITKRAANQISLTTLSTWTGPLNVEQGTLQFDSAATLSGPVAIAGQLNLVNGGTLSGAITGSGKLVVNQTGTLTTINGTTANNIATTEVLSGTLRLNQPANVPAVGNNLILSGNSVLELLANEQLPNTATITVQGTSTTGLSATSTGTETISNLIVNPSVDSGQFIFRNGFTVLDTTTIQRGIFAVASGHTGTTNRIVMAPNTIARVAANTGASTLTIGSGGIQASGGTIQVGMGTGAFDAVLNLQGNFTATGNVTITDGSYTGTFKREINLGTTSRSFDIATATTTTIAPDLAGSGGLLKRGNGTLVLTAVSQLKYTGDTIVEAGLLQAQSLPTNGNTVVTGGQLTANNLRQNSLTVQTGGKVTINANGTNAGTSVLNQLQLLGGTLDLADNDLIVQNPNTTAAQTTLQQIRIAIVSAANQGMWDGSGLTATAIIGHPSGLATLGFAHNQELGLSQFAGQTVDLQSVLVKFTYYGDSNLDGFVTDDDLGYFLAGYGVDNSQNPWLLGDYNLDGFTTDDDLGYFLASYGLSNQLNATPIQAIPEAQPWVLLGGLVLILYDRVRVWSRQKSAVLS